SPPRAVKKPQSAGLCELFRHLGKRLDVVVREVECRRSAEQPFQLLMRVDVEDPHAAVRPADVIPSDDFAPTLEFRSVRRHAGNGGTHVTGQQRQLQLPGHEELHVSPQLVEANVAADDTRSPTLSWDRIDRRSQPRAYATQSSRNPGFPESGKGWEWPYDIGVSCLAPIIARRKV